MNVPVTDAKPPVKPSMAGNTWIQITFTIDPDHYRVLWDRAEAEHRTVPGLVRESVIDFLEFIKAGSHEDKIGFETVSRAKS